MEFKEDASSTKKPVLCRLIINVTMSNNCTIVVLPGFGCDSTIFERLELPSEKVIFLDWITPLKKETLQQYAARLITPEMRYSKQLVLIGHSFGGVVMQEIGQILQPEKIILISSLTSRKGLSRGLHLVRNLGLHIWVHKPTIKGTIWMWRKGAGLQGEMKLKYKRSMNSLENRYYGWAVKNLARWNPLPSEHPNTHLIIGSADGVFSLKNADNPIVVEGGDHMMVFKKPKEVSEIIGQLLAGI
ncbi:MAG: alpha/beta hydrolase [Flavobacteriales bacterium]|nr:alpha/beta hydrolase [Flavobacteriales bacterium]